MKVALSNLTMLLGEHLFIKLHNNIIPTYLLGLNATMLIYYLLRQYAI
jgi:hypothetical protein